MGAWRVLLARLKTVLLVGASTQVAQAQQDPADLAWEATRALDTVEAYEGFLERYPDSPAADAAFEALVDRSLAATGRAPTRGLAVDIY